MPKEDYTNIPSFNLFYDCRLDEKRYKDKFIEYVCYSYIKYSINEDGEICEEKNLHQDNNEIMYYEIDDKDLFHLDENGKMIDWDSSKCREQFLDVENKKTYQSLLRSKDEWMGKLEPIKPTKFYQNVVKYFILVQTKFENALYITDESQENNELATSDDVKNSISEVTANEELDKERQHSKPVVKVDIINNCIKYINSELERLGGNYAKKDLTDICTKAYEDIVPKGKSEGKDKRIINVKEYCNAIYIKINHPFKDWNEKKFYNFMKNKISPQE